MLTFYLNAAQVVSGDLPGPTTPSARITPGIRAREALGWHLQLNAPLQKPPDLVSLAGMAEQSGVVAIGVLASQKVGANGPGLDQAPKDSIFRQSLDDAGVRVLTYRINQQPQGQSQWRDALASAQQAGAQVVIASPPARQLGRIANLCSQLDLQLAVPLKTADPESVIEPAQPVGPHAGYHVDLNDADASSVALEVPAGRIVSIQLPQSLDSTNQQRLKQLLRHVYSSTPHELVFSLDAQGAVANEVKVFDQLCIELAEQLEKPNPDPGP